MLKELKQREAEGRPIQVGLVGIGSMGKGIAFQIAKTPGMRLSFIADRDPAALAKAGEVYPHETHLTLDAMAALKDQNIPCDVLVEATNSIIGAFDYCMAAIQRKAHCVLMNAEVDAILGFLLHAEAKKHGVIVTSDSGDQHGVLARMMNEIEMWGFEIVQAGNMKGFLDRHRDMEGTVEIAKKLGLSTQQCLAYTDGSKLNIEMSIIANEYGLTPVVPGMEGPKATKMQDVIEVFDFEKYDGKGRVDYILGASEHGGGVYVVAKTESTFEQGYLNYYKVTNKHPYYVFFRPYHLCHIETPRSIALACLYGNAVCTMSKGRVTDTYAYAKKDLQPGDRIRHAIGSDEVYGLIDEAKKADAAGHVPQGVLDVEDSEARPVLKRAVKMDQPLTWDDVEIPAGRMADLWEQQKSLLGIA
ncbi:homoserine dehydrogenase [Phragmitibacter flavus]|uniref:Homoserine dehydrogenase n=1 Tax=Phragmitibacter flavus TaxID=2576071 RepID=A0A5R8KAT9_9BACT|nr:homoserine dehydrogenase [Phragmitibacter flavus]TLD69035.1 homoserine dehydrogenase [Phragmitibacter flavus]